MSEPTTKAQNRCEQVHAAPRALEARIGCEQWRCAERCQNGTKKHDLGQ